MTTSTNSLHIEEPAMDEVRQVKAHFSIDHGAIAWAQLHSGRSVKISIEHASKLLKQFSEGQRP